MIPSQLYADIPDLTDTELRIILVVIGHQGIMTMGDVQQRTGRNRQVYDAVKSLEQKGWLMRHKVASLGPVAWRWEILRYTVAPITPPVPEPPALTEPPVITQAAEDAAVSVSTVESTPVNPPKPSKAKAKAPKPVTAQHHPAVVAYMEITRRRPTHAAAELIAAHVADVDRWREAVKSYIVRGWNPMNVNGMIQVYNGDLVVKRGRHSTIIPHQSPDVAKAAWDEYLSKGEDE